MTVVNDRHPSVIFVNFAASTPGEEEKDGDTTIIWKDLMVEGVIARTPNLKRKVPFKVIASGKSCSRPDNLTVSFQDIIKSFDARAFSDVTIPDGHPKPDRVMADGRVIKGDSALNNTGYVTKLRVIQKDVTGLDGNTANKFVLQCGMGFTEPDAAAKVKRGSVPNVSAGVFFDFVRQADQRYFPVALNHVALTKSPWMGDLESFKRAYFSEGDDEYEFSELMLDDNTTTDNSGAKVIWDEVASSRFVRDAISAALNPKRNMDGDDSLASMRPQAWYYVDDVTHDGSNLANVQEEYRGRTTHFVVPWKKGDDGKVEVSAQTHWVEGKQAMIAASDDEFVSEKDTMVQFEDHSYESMLGKINTSLEVQFGDKALVADRVSMNGKALVRNTKTGAEYVVGVKSQDGHIFLAADEDWETIKVANKKPPDQQPPAATSVTFDLSNAEGRVQAARQRRAELMSSTIK